MKNLVRVSLVFSWAQNAGYKILYEMIDFKAVYLCKNISLYMISMVEEKRYCMKDFCFNGWTDKLYNFFY